MNTSSIRHLGRVATRVLVAGALTWALAQNASADLKHRYSFNTDNDASDSIGTAHGTIMNNTYVAGGVAYFSSAGGTVTSGATCDYIELPANMINGFTAATFEMWIDVYANANWSEIYGFGNQNASGAGAHMLMFTPHSGSGDFRMSYAQADPGYNDEHVVVGTGTLDNLGPCVITCVYDPANNTMSLYKDGLLVNSVTVAASVGFDLSKIQNNYSWLGRSLYNGDAAYDGTIDEFRIYNNPLNSVEVAASFVSGAANPSTDPAVLGSVQAVHLVVPQTTMTQGDAQPTSATVDFAQLAGVALKGVPGVTYASDMPAVVSVSQIGVIEALAPGSANVTLSYGGQSTAVPIIVNPRQTGVATAGKLWVDLRADDVKTDTSTWPNRTGEGDFVAFGTPVYMADVEGTGLAGVSFNGTDTAYQGPLTDLDIVNDSDRSIEVWAYNPAINDEETLVAWSHRGGPDGSNLSFNYGANATYGAVGHWGSPDVGWSGTPLAGLWHYLVYTYNGDKIVRVYADGVLKTEEILTAPLATHANDYIRLAAQANTAGTDFDFGQALSGYIASVRVHGGMLSAGDVANNFLYGAEGTAPGELQGVVLKLTATTLVGPRALGQASVTADFANRKYLNVLPFTTLESSDPSVLTVDANGAYTALKAGTAMIKATYSGKEASQQVTVLAPPATELKHRYSFSEAAGSTTVKDSIGSADGTLKGLGADFDGAGKLTLPGGGASNAGEDVISGYVDLPNGMISSLVNVSIEAWVSWQAPAQWARVYDFGTSSGGENVSDGNGAYLFLTPFTTAEGGSIRFAVRDPRTANEPTVLNAATPAAGSEHHLVVTYDYTGNQTVMYLNGAPIATGASATPLNLIHDVNNWLGRSQWADNMFAGTYNEFRIWEGALTADQVAACYAAGPDTLPSTETQPTLAVSTAAGSVVIAWPATSTYLLESTAALGPAASWSAVDTSSAVVEGGQKKLTLTPSQAATFYRMKK